MAETRDSRAERREEIKLRLEYLKVAISLGVIGTILFAGLQWQIANQAAARANQIANEAVYQRMTNEWRDHLKTFVDKEKAALRPYFEEKKQLASDDPNRQVVLALADVRLDVMDAILTYATMRSYQSCCLLAFNRNSIQLRACRSNCARGLSAAASQSLISPCQAN
jgi:DNA-binding protein Fis